MGAPKNRGGRWIKKIVPATTNNLNTAIVNHLLSNGHSASRVNVTGIWDGEKQLFRKAAARLGFFDIVACIKPMGLYFAVDTKRGNDKPSDEQLAYKEEVIMAGGLAIFAKTYEDYLKFYQIVIQPLIDYATRANQS
jgi:hypothetical protein